MQNRRSLLATALLLAFARVAKARLMSTQLKPPPNAQGMTLTFHDEFDGPLDISYNTPGTKWTITPYNNSYALDAASDAYDPAHGVNAFSVANSILTITMSKDSSGVWHSGI